MDTDTTQQNFSNDTNGLIPFDAVRKHFTRKDIFNFTMSSTKVKNQQQFVAFGNELEDLMRKYGVYQVIASIFADL